MVKNSTPQLLLWGNSDEREMWCTVWSSAAVVTAASLLLGSDGVGRSAARCLHEGEQIDSLSSPGGKQLSGLWSCSCFGNPLGACPPALVAFSQRSVSLVRFRIVWFYLAEVQHQKGSQSTEFSLTCVLSTRESCVGVQLLGRVLGL